VTLKADATAAIDVAHLTVHGSATEKGLTVQRTASFMGPRGAPAIDTVLLAVALPTPFKIKGDYQMSWAARGSVYQRGFKIERTGYDGPITVSLADRQARHLQGVVGSKLVVPAGATEFSYPVTLPPWMETGRTSRTCVMGVATIKDTDGREHEACFSSTQTNDQLVVVVEPGRLGVETERGTLRLNPSQPVTLPIRISRSKGVDGPATVELIIPAHVKGLTVAPVQIPAKQGQGQLTLRATASAGPFNMPLTIRATVMEQGRPVVAETKVELELER
jgi:hypothetical protein